MSSCRLKGALATLPILPMLVPYGVKSTCAFIGRDAAAWPLLWDGCELGVVRAVPLAQPDSPSVTPDRLFTPVVSGLQDMLASRDPFGVFVCCWSHAARPEPDKDVEEYEHLAGAAVPAEVTPCFLFNQRDDTYPPGLLSPGEAARLTAEPLVWRMRNRGAGLCVAVGADGDVLVIKWTGASTRDQLANAMRHVCEVCDRRLTMSQSANFLSDVAKDVPPWEVDMNIEQIWRMYTSQREGPRYNDGDPVDPLELLLSDFVPTMPDGRGLWSADDFAGLVAGSRPWCVAQLIAGCEESGVPYRKLLREMMQILL